MIRRWNALGAARLRAFALDAAIVVLAVLTTVSIATSADPAVARHRVALLMVSVAAILVFLPRRHQTLLVCAASFGGWAAASVLSAVSTTPMFVGALVTFALSGYLCPPGHATIAWVIGAVTAAFATSNSLPEDQWLGDFALTMVFCTAMWGAGLLVGMHRRRAAHAAAELDAERVDRSAAIDAATRQEQARIAVDLHDVVSHGLSVVVVQAVAAQAALDAPAELARRLDAIEVSARDALAEMRHMLGLLQQDQDAALDALPTLRMLPKLLENAAGAGLDVAPLDLRLEHDLPPGTELTAFRVIQEAVTNAITHAPGSALRVCVTAIAAKPLEVIVENTAGQPGGSTSGSGRGLVGMRQRARVSGGTLEAASTAGGGFRVRLTLPAGRA